MAQQPPVGQGPSLSKIHNRTQLDTPHSVGLPWMSDQPVASPVPDNTQHSQQTDIHVPGGNGIRALTGTGEYTLLLRKYPNSTIFRPWDLRISFDFLSCDAARTGYKLEIAQTIQNAIIQADG